MDGRQAGELWVVGRTNRGQHGGSTTADKLPLRVGVDRVEGAYLPRRSARNGPAILEASDLSATREWPGIQVARWNVAITPPIKIVVLTMATIAPPTDWYFFGVLDRRPTTNQEPPLSCGAFPLVPVRCLPYCFGCWNCRRLTASGKGATPWMNSG